MAAQKQQTTTIHAQGPNWTLKIILPVAGLIALVIFGTMFYSQVKILIAGSVALFLAGGVIRGAFWIGYQIFDFLDRMADYQQKRLASKVHHTPSGLFYIPDSRVVFVPPTVSERKALGAGGVVIEQLPNLIDAIKDETCVMVFGYRGAGKTNTALHWLATRPGTIVVCDPKPRNKNAWPTSYIFGTGGNYQQILQTVYQVRAELDRRVKQEILNAPELTLFLDELFQLVKIQQLPIMMPVFEIITIGRDYRVNAGFTTSDKGVEALDIKGMSGLREALTAVEVKIVDGQYKTFADLGSGMREYAAPGKYQPRGGSLQLPAYVAPDPKLTDKQAEVKALYKSGQTDRRQIMLEVYGDKAGGKQWQAVNSVIDNL